MRNSYNFKETYRKVRTLRIRRIKEKWSLHQSGFADAAMSVEIEEEKTKPILLAGNFRKLGALGHWFESTNGFSRPRPR